MKQIGELKMKYRIGVMGSAGRGKKLPETLLEKAKELGREIARSNCLLITGACMGTPQEAAIGASEENGIVLGFSPASNLKEHTEPPISYPLPTKNTILIFTGFGKEGRIVLSSRNCDAVIFIAGSVGTLTEFSLAYHMGKVIGILEGSGGISDKISEIAKSIQKDTGTVLISDPDPKNLVRKIIETLKKRENA